MTHSSDLLSSEEIAAASQGQLNPRFVHVMTHTTSTNDEARKLALAGAPEGTLILADKQTAGRGRMGRTWESPPQKNLYLSLILRPTLAPRDLSQITLVAGLACFEALRNLGLTSLHLKWPNDLWVGNKKLGGVLSEMESKVEKTHFVILGIGLNVNATLEDFSPELSKLATSLQMETNKPHSRSQLAGKVVSQFFKEYAVFVKQGFAALKSRWEEASQMKGKKVRISDSERSFEGVCEGLEDSGALLVKTAIGLEKVIAGNVDLCS